MTLEVPSSFMFPCTQPVVVLFLTESHGRAIMFLGRGMLKNLGGNKGRLVSRWKRLKEAENMEKLGGFQGKERGTSGREGNIHFTSPCGFSLVLYIMPSVYILI